MKVMQVDSSQNVVYKSVYWLYFIANISGQSCF
jgi:hypothetical protein